MRFRRLPAILLGVVALLVVSATVLQGGKRPPTNTEVPMAATFVDNSGDRIMSDGLGPYTNGEYDVRAVIDASGNFDLKTPTRILRLDFGAPASPDATAPFETGTEAAYMSTGCGGFQDMTVGESVRSRLAINFTYGGQNWFIRFAPAEYPDTSNVLVTRTAEDTWEIQAAATDIAKLVTMPIKGRPVTTEHGNFFLPFKVVVKKM